MWIAAALLELTLHEADSIKAKRRVVRSIKDRLRARFNVAVAEVDDHDDWHSICIGLSTVGSDPRHIHERLRKALRFVEGLGLAEVVGDDVIVVRLDELESTEEDPAEGDDVPASWREE